MLSINELHGQVRSGDATAEARLFEMLAARFKLFAHQRMGNTQDCEEVVQDALMCIAREYKEIEFETSFAAWSYRVLENRLLHFLRSRRRERSHEELDVNDPTHGAVQPDPALKSRLLECLRKICTANVRYARTLNLQYQGYTAAEICERFEITRNNLYVVLSRARAMLENCLETGELS